MTKFFKGASVSYYEKEGSNIDLKIECCDGNIDEIIFTADTEYLRLNDVISNVDFSCEEVFEFNGKADVSFDLYEGGDYDGDIEIWISPEDKKIKCFNLSTNVPYVQANLCIMYKSGLCHILA